jgi:DNA-binding winged helix-turn-helix (wHTH) protein
MPQKSEKIIFINLQNLILKKIFSELIPFLNQEINDFQFVLSDLSNRQLHLSSYFISDLESINQLIDDDLSGQIKKIFLISNKTFNFKTNIDVVHYDLPLKFLNFIEYVIQDLKQNFNKEDSIISMKSTQYDQSARLIFNDTISITLTEKENEIFDFLLSSKKSVNKKELLKNIWQYNESIDTHTLETHVYSLRKKLEKKLKIKNILEHNENGYFLNKDLL